MQFNFSVCNRYKEERTIWEWIKLVTKILNIVERKKNVYFCRTINYDWKVFTWRRRVNGPRTPGMSCILCPGDTAVGLTGKPMWSSWFASSDKRRGFATFRGLSGFLFCFRGLSFSSASFPFVPLWPLSLQVLCQLCFISSILWTCARFKDNK